MEIKSQGEICEEGGKVKVTISKQIYKILERDLYHNFLNRI